MKLQVVSFFISSIVVLASGVAYIQANYYDKEDVRNKFKIIEYKIKEVKTSVKSLKNIQCALIKKTNPDLYEAECRI